MAIHVKDKDTEALVRELKRKIEPILDEIRKARRRKFSAEEDKAFMGEMWGEES
jgi:hypothetical protein